MKDKTKQAITDALDKLASAKPARTNGKITGLNLAKEAGVSKATLYRYLNDHIDLQTEYATLRKNGVSEEDVVPETLEQAYRLASEEVKMLRSALSDEREAAAQASKLRANQVLLLWLEIERLREENEKLASSLAKSAALLRPSNIE
ncbi:hypothetical protein [Massilia sp. Mn16-1_5]|uniref:hypothetical protein n=1 Tax=Massilia sp. Mn16-1_5 TaxID=2079199 RepID=UPI00109EB6CC|nr:hypothetical protein [Massilia sp. Mn16-1_5]